MPSLVTRADIDNIIVGDSAKSVPGLDENVAKMITYLSKVDINPVPLVCVPDDKFPNAIYLVDSSQVPTLEALRRLGKQQVNVLIVNGTPDIVAATMQTSLL